jgi:pyruvate,water dikinase
MRNKINLNKNWIYLVNRMYTLFGTSLWQAWFDSAQIMELFGISIADNLYVEEHPNVVRRYVIGKQLETFEKMIKDIVTNDRIKTKDILEKGISLSAEAKKYIKKSPFSELRLAVEFLVKLALNATVFSYFSYPKIKEKNDKELLILVKKLRAVSYYPKVVEKIINPLARKQIGKDFEIMTISEVLAKDKSRLKSRKESKKKNKRFVYQKISGRESIEYVDDAMEIISKLEEINITDSVKGMVAYPGKAIGRARLILTSNTNIKFDKGDILVVVSSNPTLMALIKKCGAIVADEGGITSHAAIVSRELKKPCVIGTKFATHTFKDGDLVEVDANGGVVRIIKKAK